MDAEQKTIWAYMKDLTDEVQRQNIELKVLKNVIIKMSPSEYFDHLKKTTKLTPQEEEYQRAKYGI